MLNWFAGLFGPAKTQSVEFYDEVDKEWLDAEIERIQAEEEHKHWLFIVGLASELYPGDNKGVERVEEAVKKVLANIMDK
jgi:hypothetical protein